MLVLSPFHKESGGIESLQNLCKVVQLITRVRKDFQEERHLRHLLGTPANVWNMKISNWVHLWVGGKLPPVKKSNQCV